MRSSKLISVVPRTLPESHLYSFHFIPTLRSIDFFQSLSAYVAVSMSRQPYVTGTSVLGLIYEGGVLIAADTAGSYGSTTRFKSVERMKAVSNNTLLGASGEISDFQAITQLLDRLIVADAMWDDGNDLGPLDIHNYLTRVMYNRRNKFDPLWNTLILGGVKNGVKHLGSVSMIGVHYVDNHIATGFGIHLAQPIFREEWKENMTLEEGTRLLEKALLVLFYRDRSAINKIQVANVTEDGVHISQPYALKSEWNLEAFKNPTASAAGSW
uniref:Proteasome subunit beta n=1 Tax=Physcomitrium patens TaxID=3218 RepID=A0A2K1ICM1_PHYPA|nr:hypothetical protein PHYPA_030506 [Physcomitrium patens]